MKLLNKPKLSVVLATYNEEKNIGQCLKSVEGLADETVVVDGSSTDKTREIAKGLGAKVVKTTNPLIFHINKQKALDKARGEWILQLDADERVTGELAREIKEVVKMSDEKIHSRKVDPKKKRLFLRHQELVEKRDGKIGTEAGEIVAFFVPRRNYFLGKAMTYAGIYPDGVIRLVKKGKAWFPSKTVHEQIQIDGTVDWLYSDLVHLSNPTLGKYISGADKYTNLLADRIKNQKASPILAINYLILKPLVTFTMLLVRHKGILDGIHGFLFSLFSALHFPVAYLKSWIR